MDNSIDMGSIIANRGLNFAYPYGGAGYGGGVGGNFREDGSVVNAKTEANGDMLRQILSDNKIERLSDRVADSEVRASDRLAQQTVELLKSSFENRLATESNAGKLDVIKQQLEDVPYYHHRHRHHDHHGDRG